MRKFEVDLSIAVVTDAENMGTAVKAALDVVAPLAQHGWKVQSLYTSEKTKEDEKEG